MKDRIIFTDIKDSGKEEGIFEGILNRRIDNTKQLLNEIAISLQFPKYFGQNWNALSDCLRDFHWIEMKKIYLIHRDIPAVNERDLCLYIDILSNAVDDWREGEGHEFFVIFPTSSENKIRILLEQ